MKSLDPMRTEIVRSLVASVAEEMGQILRRASLSPNIRERLDFSTAVFDRQGELVAHAEHIPVHLGSMVASIRARNSTISANSARIIAWASGGWRAMISSVISSDMPPLSPNTALRV